MRQTLKRVNHYRDRLCQRSGFQHSFSIEFLETCKRGSEVVAFCAYLLLLALGSIVQVQGLHGIACPGRLELPQEYPYGPSYQFTDSQSTKDSNRSTFGEFQ